MSASIAISSAALASSAAANYAATAAKKTACTQYIHGYKAETATTQEMQEYASCVRLLYPDEMTGAEGAALKVAIVLALIGICIGAYKGFQDDKFVGAAMFGLLGALLLPFAAGCIVFVIAGVVFLFS